MGAAKRIIEELKTGITPEDLARKIPWKELSGDDGDDLLAVALRLGDNQQSYNLLVYLFHISFGKDLWFSTEVLSQAVQHPNMTLLDRQAILPTMRGRLDQIKDQIGTKTPPEEKLTKYWLMEASYYSVNGNMLSEMGKRIEATHNYQIAQSIFEQLGLFQKAAEYKALNRRLLSKEVNKSPLPKTSPIRLHMPPTQPISLANLGDQPQPKPDALGSAPSKANGVPPFIDEQGDKNIAIPTGPQGSPAKNPEPFTAEVVLEDIGNQVTAVLVSPDLSPAENLRPSAGTRVETIHLQGVGQVAPEPKKLVEEPPSIPTPSQPKEGSLQASEAEQPHETVLIIPSDDTVLITPEPQGVTPAPQEVAPASQEATSPTEEVTSVSQEITPEPQEVTPVSPEVSPESQEVAPASPEATPPPAQPAPAEPNTGQPNPEVSSATQPASYSESPSVTGIYYPLPDVWLEDGRLHILGVDRFKGDAAADQSEQIRQQCDILIGIQLQIKMYQTRRRMLDQEMKQMENKVSALQARIDRLESKAIQLESAEEIPAS